MDFSRQRNEYFITQFVQLLECLRVTLLCIDDTHKHVSLVGRMTQVLGSYSNNGQICRSRGVPAQWAISRWHGERREANLRRKCHRNFTLQEGILYYRVAAAKQEDPTPEDGGSGWRVYVWTKEERMSWRLV